MKKILGFLAMLVLVGLDQITKYFAITKLMNKKDFVIADGVLRFHYLENKGVAWGMFSGKVLIFVITTIIFGALITYVYLKIPSTKKYVYLRIICVLLLAGAVGNFIDRVFRHYVVDFIYFELINFPVFNVADIFVTVSGIALLIFVFFYYKEEDFAFLKINKKNK